MRTLVLTNHKGGCAKTTTAMNLAVVLATEGHRVLAIDLDPQGNLSVALGADLEELETTQRTSLRMMLDRNGDYKEYLTKARHRLDLIPACLDFDGQYMLEGQPVSRDLMLKDKLNAAQFAYDYCIVDTPPSLNSLTLNALSMSDMTIIPIESSLFALVGLNSLLTMIGRVRRAHAQEMIIMALSTMHVPRQNHDKDVRSIVIKRFTPENVFEATIPRSVAVSQAITNRLSVYESDSASPAAISFLNLAKEIEHIFSEESVPDISTTIQPQSRSIN